MAASRPDLLSRSEIARLAGVERPAVTNWERRHVDFPKPVVTPEGLLFRRQEVIAWLSPRRIPAKALRPGESPGATYGDRLSASHPLNRRPDATSPTATGPGPVPRLASLLADAPRTALREGSLWHVVLGLAFVRRFEPEVWRELAAQPDPSGLRQVLSGGFADAGLPEAARTMEGLVALTPAVFHSLGRVIDLLANVAVNEGVPGAEGDELTELFDYAFDRLADEVRYAFVTPVSVARLIAELMGPLSGAEACFDPFCRAGELLVELLRRSAEVDPLPTRVDGAHPSSVMVELARMNVAMHSSGRVLVGMIKETDELSTYGDFDVVVTNPPFGTTQADEVERGRYGPSRRREMMLLQTVVESFGAKGRGAVVMPNVAAFGHGAADRAVRRALVEDGAVAAVVALPPNLFAETAIGVMLWLVQRPTGSPGEVLFIDAQALGRRTSRTRRELSPEDIAKIVGEYRRWQAARRAGSRFAGMLAFSRSVAPEVLGAHEYSFSPSSYVDDTVAERDGASVEDIESLGRELSRLTERARRVDAQVAELFGRLGQG